VDIERGGGLVFRFPCCLKTRHWVLAKFGNKFSVCMERIKKKGKSKEPFER